MATSLIEAIQQQLGFAPLEKLDPNIQEARRPEFRNATEKLSQAAIPAVLAAMFNLSRSGQGANYILNSNSTSGWADALFGPRKQDAIEKVSSYAGVSHSEAEATMDKVAVAAVPFLKRKAGTHGFEGLRTYLGNQRHHILVHLPAAMQMGYLLNDNSMDDRTNKMEGPVSNLMHRIENLLSKGGRPHYP